MKQFKRLINDWSDENLMLGCPLNNLTQEMSAVDTVFREKLQTVMTLWVDETEKYLKKAQADGYLKKNVNTKQLAGFIVTTREGAFGMAKTMRDRKMINSLYNSLKDNIELKSEVN